MTMNVFLFDIDGTIITFRGGTYSPFRRVAMQFFKLKEITFDIPYAGRTDVWLTRMLYRKYFDKEIEPHLLNAFLEEYANEFKNNINNLVYNVHVGVKSLIQKLYYTPNTLLAVITGNIAATAREKLKLAGVDHFFEMGMFGDNREDRNKMVKDLIAMIQHKYGKIDKVFIIGDTPFDIESAKHNAAIAVAVGTGPRYNIEQLRQYNPHLLYEDFSNVEQVYRDFMEYSDE